MALTRTKFYTLMGVACGAGYAWLFANYHTYQQEGRFNVCIIKRATSLPCPSCGSTRAVEALIHGHFIESILWNPIGILLVAILIIAPLWIVKDMISKSNSFYNWHKNFEILLKKKRYAIPLIMLVMANWIWNMYKGL